MANTSTSDSRKSPNTALSSPGPYLAKVVGHLDPTYMGELEVELLHESGNDNGEEGQLHNVKYLSPFAGQTNLLHVKNTDNYANTQKSYGFWMIPPDPGVIVMCIFVDGDPRKGYWFGCVQDHNMNFMMPGNAATEIATAKGTNKARVPVAEYNKVVHEGTSQNDLTQIKKPATPQETILSNQGLLEDDIRGITTSSARREVPSSVFGISTPGPIDKSGPKGEYGKKQWRIKDKPVNRLGGSSFVMDDGDDKWERTDPPSEGPPTYAHVEAGEKGLRDRPHNELIRLRTRTGHQILLHNSEDLIYIGNARGTAWIELTSNGKMDVYCEDSISIRTKQDFNFYADRDVNIEAGRNINIKAAGKMQTEAGADYNLLIGANGKITVSNNFDLKTGDNNKFTASGNTDINSGGNHTETAARIDMNGPQAAIAAEVTALSTIANVQNSGSITSIMKRIPSREPWPHHENLNPAGVKSENTDRESDSVIAVPPAWKTYSTTTDTFKR